MAQEIVSDSRKLYYITTELCNLGCSYCYYNSALKERTKPTKILLDEKLGLFRDMPKHFDETIFTGGEALVDPNVFKLIEASKQSGLKVDLLTNGVLLTFDNCQKLVDLEVDCVSVSLDSLNPAVNDKVRGKTAETQQGIENLLAVRTSDMAIEIMMTVTRQNISSIRPMVDYCFKNDFNLWLDPVEINSEIGRLQSLDLGRMSEPEKQKLAEEFSYWVQQTRNPALSLYAQSCLKLISRKKANDLACDMGTNHFVLNVDGSMNPCFSRTDIIYGNAYQDGLSAVMESPLIVENQEELQSASCVSLGCVCMTMVTEHGPSNKINN